LTASNVAPATRHRCTGLRAAFVALLVTPTLSVTLAAAAVPRAEPRQLQPARFSDLAELTPANVQGLLPLVARGLDARLDDQGTSAPQRSPGHRLQVDSLAGADLRLQRFLDERVNLQLATEEPAHLPAPGALGYEISYAIGTPPAAAEPAAARQGEHELRAWDPIERRVVWSVTEASPISARTLITAGGLVFYGTSDGWLKALDARSGRTLWKHRAEGRALEAPFSYRGADGHQYIGVHSRPTGAAAGSEVLLIFALAH
jgi:hypothetical protein